MQCNISAIMTFEKCRLYRGSAICDQCPGAGTITITLPETTYLTLAHAAEMDSTTVEEAVVQLCNFVVDKFVPTV